MEAIIEKDLTCITCPLGCTLHVTIKDGEFASVTGNTCKRGADYACAEINHPVRTLTTTVAIKGRSGRVLPVKSLTPLPKEKLLEAMKIINQAEAVLPIHAGDIILSDVFGSSIAATQSME